jgi:hypothetical protein
LALIFCPFGKGQRRKLRRTIPDIGIGVLSGITKPLSGRYSLCVEVYIWTSLTGSGILGVVTYPLVGLEAEILQQFSTTIPYEYERSILQQGIDDAALLNDAEKERIVRQWDALKLHTAKGKLKTSLKEIKAAIFPKSRRYK